MIGKCVALIGKHELTIKPNILTATILDRLLHVESGNDFAAVLHGTCTHKFVYES